MNSTHHDGNRAQIDRLEPRRLLATLAVGGVITADQPAPTSATSWRAAADVPLTGIGDPVVVLGVVSNADGEPLAPRVRDVSAAGFELMLDEWDYLDGTHGQEAVPYLAAEAGTHTTDAGDTLAAGRATADDGWTRVSFEHPFGSAPLVFTQVASFNGPSAVTTRVRNVTAAGFDVRLVEEQANDGSHSDETVHWIATDADGVSTDGYSAGRWPGVTNTGVWTAFGTELDATPVALVQMQTANDEDPAVVRRTSANAYGTYSFIQEEQSADSETGHAGETLGHLALPAGTITGDRDTGGSGGGGGGGNTDAGVFANRRYPFADSVPTDQAAADARIRQEYAEWRTERVTTVNAGELRVVGDFPNYGVIGGTVSEGIGYGMLLSVLADDKATFDGLWRFAKNRMPINGNGLVPFLYDANGNVTNFNGGSGARNATDGDLDIAYALVAATAKWSGVNGGAAPNGSTYEQDARDIIDAMMTHNVRANNTLKNGDYNSDTINTSYQATAYFRMFADFTGNTRWDAIARRSIELLQTVVDRHSSVGITPHDMSQTGDLVSYNRNHDSDASRISWRLGIDYAWYGDRGAKKLLDGFNDFYDSRGLGNLYDAYFLNGQQINTNGIGGWGGSQAGWIAGASVASHLGDRDPADRAAAWQAALGANDDLYYSTELRLIGMMAAAGWQQNPMQPQDTPFKVFPDRTFKKVNLFDRGGRGLFRPGNEDRAGGDMLG